MPFQRITVFGDNDVTPLFGGTVDGSGNVTNPSFSTDPAHSHPYLCFIEDIGESEVDFKEGKSVIGTVNIELIDKSTSATDQTMGYITSILATNGLTNLMGHRVLFEQQDPTGSTWYTVLDGVVSGDIELDESLASYKFVIRDIRDRERKAHAFVQASSTSFIPSGIVNGWGKIVQWQDPGTGTPVPVLNYLIPPADFVYGTFKLDNSAGTGKQAGYVDISALYAPNKGKVGTPQDLAQWMGEFFAPINIYNTDGSLFEAQYSNVIIQWRPASPGTGAWTTLKNMPVMKRVNFYPQGSEGNAVFSYGVDAPGGTGADLSKATKLNFIRVAFNSNSAAERPTHGQDIHIRFISGRPPSDDAPLFIEDKFGQILKDLYDGVYSTGPTGIRYDATAMQAFIDVSPYARVKITEQIDDIRAWTEENIYKPMGYAPVVINGKIYPTPYLLPAAGASLIQLDDTNCAVENSKWVHSEDEAVNRVSFTYIRDYLVNDPNVKLLERLREVEVRFERINTTVLNIGDKLLEYAPVTVRDVTTSANGQPMGGNVSSELGALLAKFRCKEAIDRFAYGAQKIVVHASRTDAAVASAKIGDWCQVALSWMPDYASGKRGINRIAQIKRVREIDPAWREFELLDAGPNITPLTQVTVNNFVANSDDTFSCTVVTLPTVGGVQSEARVDYAIGTSAPASTSGDWIPFLRTPVVGTFKTPALPAGSVVWFRYRAEKAGYRPSAWSTPVSVTSTFQARAGNIRAFLYNEVATVQFDPGNAGGVRVYYGIYAIGAAQPALTTFVDYAVVTAQADLPIVVPSGYNIDIRVDSYPRFTSGAVAGTLGAQSGVITLTRPVVGTNPPSASIAVVSGNLSGETIQYIGSAPSGNISMRRRIDLNTGAGTFGAASASLANETVSRGLKYAKRVVLEVTDTSTGLVTLAQHVIDAARPVITDNGQMDLSDSTNILNKNLDNVAETTARKHLSVAAKQALLQRSPNHGRQMLLNASFEDDFNFWQSGTGRTIITDSTKAHGGNKYLQVVQQSVGVGISSAQVDDTGATRYFEVFEGDIIQYGGWGYRETGDANCRWTIGSYDKDKLNPSFFPATNTNSASWTEGKGEYTVPAGKKYIILYSEIISGTALTTARFDDGYLRILRPADDIATGSMRNGILDNKSRKLVEHMGKGSGSENLADILDNVPATGNLRGVHNSAVDGSGNIQAMKTGRIDNALSNPTRGIRLNAAFAIPSTWRSYIDLDPQSDTAAMIYFEDPLQNPIIRLTRGGTLTIYGTVKVPSGAQMMVDGGATFTGAETHSGNVEFIPQGGTSGAGKRLAVQSGTLSVLGSIAGSDSAVKALIGSYPVTIGAVTQYTDSTYAPTSDTTGSVNVDAPPTAGTGVVNSVDTPGTPAGRMPAIDNKYTIPFTLRTRATGGGAGYTNVTADSSVYAYYQRVGVDVSYQPYGIVATDTQTVVGTNTAGTTKASPISITLTIPGVTSAGLNIKLVPQVSVSGGIDKTGSGGAPAGNGQATIDTFGTMTWNGTSGTVYQRRGVKIGAEPSSPGLYIEPHSAAVNTVPLESNTAEGEAWVDSDQQMLAIRHRGGIGELRRKIERYLTADAASSTGSGVWITPTGWSFNVKAGERWHIHFTGQLLGNATGGVVVNIQLSNGATITDRSQDLRGNTSNNISMSSTYNTGADVGYVSYTNIGYIEMLQDILFATDGTVSVSYRSGGAATTTMKRGARFIATLVGG